MRIDPERAVVFPPAGTSFLYRCSCQACLFLKSVIQCTFVCPLI
uniref:Uncharacterized protein n=1 Tax=Anguilla anguilla TaxID=7936 RepID=A0A0E9W5P0_ANGAN